MFDGFDLDVIPCGEISVRVRHGGRGPALVLLHGHPRTHTTWHAVAPLLADRFTVVCPDLRGYGGSSKPSPTVDHTTYSDRAMAADLVRLMTELGQERFAVVGHDRGSYVAYRTALDHPDRVTHLGVCDSVPILEALERCDAHFAAKWWHWFFYGQTEKRAERIISADPDAWYGGDPVAMGQGNFDDYQLAIHDPATVLAMMEDYRAGLTVDRSADLADRAAGRRIECPTLVLWSAHDDMEALYGDPVAVWRDWVEGDLTGVPIDSDHHMAEEAPEEMVTALERFLQEYRPSA